jgi:hypothetical protein
VSIEEGSHSWLANITLADPEDIGRINMGDPIRLLLAGEEYRLIVDRKNHSQSTPQRINATIRAISPLALLGAPWVAPISQEWSAGADAAQVVQTLIGTVDWRLPDWTISSGQLAAAHTDPLALARQVVEAAGGVIESLPDGSIVCRHLFPTPVPEMASAVADYEMNGDSILSHDESLDVVEIVNRLIVCDATVSSSNAEIAIEQDSHPTDPSIKLIRVYPIPWRPVSVVHTGDALVGLEYIGVEERQETELLEFNLGSATTRYPVLAINAYAWQYKDLGVPEAVVESKSVVVSGSDGQSLLRITYTTRCQLWQATDPRDEEILFLAYD